jgi:menaquinone-dependent protoporphyrinogen oxidase
MKPILIVYATREGQTRRIAEHIAADIRAHGRTAEVANARDPQVSRALAGCAAVVVAASIHMGKHEPEMVAFVREQRSALETLPAAFLSVSMAEAGAEDERASAESRAQARRDVEEQIKDFFDRTAWHPARVKPVAGALLYTKYNFIVRFMMKQIVKKKGGSTDTSRDHEYTDWAALDHFVSDLLHDLPA